MESLETRFKKHPKNSINGNTGLDDEFIDIIRREPELDCLLKMDIDRSLNPRLIYFKIIIKLCIFESQDIETLITEYKPSEFWDSLEPAERRELIEKTLFIQEQKEQEALESIGTAKKQKNQPIKGTYFTWRKGS